MALSVFVGCCFDCELFWDISFSVELATTAWLWDLGQLITNYWDFCGHSYWDFVVHSVVYQPLTEVGIHVSNPAAFYRVEVDALFLLVA